MIEGMLKNFSIPLRLPCRCRAKPAKPRLLLKLHYPFSSIYLDLESERDRAKLAQPEL